jgi:hypothetical protein
MSLLLAAEAFERTESDCELPYSCACGRVRSVRRQSLSESGSWSSNETLTGHFRFAATIPVVCSTQ